MNRRVAILLAFDLERLDLHQMSEREALVEVDVALKACGFSLRLPGLYMGGCEIDTVLAIVATQNLAARFPWFEPCLRDARLLRIEEDSDLSIALRRADLAAS